MRLDEQEYLDLIEGSGKLVFVDIEATGLRGDYNSILCASFKPYGKKPYTVRITQPGNDQRVAREAKEELEKYSAWCTYYGKGFDLPMINTRLLKWELLPVDKRPHIDMYYTLKANTLTARRSQGHLLSFLETPEEKMTVGAEEWNRILYDTERAMKTMVRRCESDVAGLEALYRRTRHLIREIKR